MSKDAEPGRDALIYNPSRVSWAVAETVAMPPSTLARTALYFILSLLAGAVVFAHLTTVTVTVTGAGMLRIVDEEHPGSAADGRTGRSAERPGRQGREEGRRTDRVRRSDRPHEPGGRARDAHPAQRRDQDGEHAGRREGGGIVAQAPMRLQLSVLVRERTVLAESASALYQALRGMQDVGALAAADRAERDTAAAKIQKIKSQGLQAQLGNELADLEAAVTRANVSMHGRYDQAVQRVDSARAALEVQIKAFEQTLDTHNRAQHILSPADGVLHKVTVGGVGELINPGTVLFEVIPSGGNLVAEVSIANKDISQLKVGMPVLLRLEALPYQDYGALPGHIIEIPPDATVSQQGGATYVIKVSPDQTTLDGGQGPRSILLGMSLLAEVQIRRRTLLELVLVEVLKLKDVI